MDCHIKFIKEYTEMKNATNFHFCEIKQKIKKDSCPLGLGSQISICSFFICGQHSVEAFTHLIIDIKEVINKLNDRLSIFVKTKIMKILLH